MLERRLEANRHGLSPSRSLLDFNLRNIRQLHLSLSNNYRGVYPSWR
jgi:hypothetical protein